MNQNEFDWTIEAWGAHISDTCDTLREFALWLNAHNTIDDVRRRDVGVWIKRLDAVGLATDWIAQDISVLPGKAGAVSIDKLFQIKTEF